jgi:hypothetical protein
MCLFFFGCSFRLAGLAHLVIIFVLQDRLRLFLTKTLFWTRHLLNSSFSLQDQTRFRGWVRAVEVDGRPVVGLLKRMRREPSPPPGACDLAPCLNGGRCAATSWSGAAFCDCSATAFQGEAILHFSEKYFKSMFIQ